MAGIPCQSAGMAGAPPLFIRCEPHEKATIDRAAAACGVSTNRWALGVILDRARKVLADPLVARKAARAPSGRSAKRRPRTARADA